TTQRDTGFRWRSLREQAQSEPRRIRTGRGSPALDLKGGRMNFLNRSRISGTLAVAWLVACPGMAFANSDVEKLTADSENWAMQAGDMYNQRYSKLTQINAQNVGKLQVAWMFSTGRSEERRVGKECKQWWSTEH